MKVIQNLPLPGLHGKPITTDIFYKEDGQPKPVVIFSHGFKGFKDWGHFNRVAREFVQAGFVFVKFNFAYNGTTTESPMELGDTEAFGNNNLTKELDDLGVVIDHVWNDPALQKEIDRSKLYLLGHSRGGGITMLKAAEDERVKRLVTWASVGEFGVYWNEAVVKQMLEKGVVYVENSRTKQQLPMYKQYYENFLANKGRLDVKQAVQRLQVPFLAIHGTADEVVPHAVTDQLIKWNPTVQVLTLEGANHVFGARHPYPEETLPKDAEKVIAETIRFLK